MVSRVHLVISLFIVKSLFSVPVDVAITLIVNHVNFLCHFLIVHIESLVVSLLFIDLASAVAQHNRPNPNVTRRNTHLIITDPKFNQTE